MFQQIYYWVEGQVDNQCEKCGKIFKYTSYLTDHINKKHNEDEEERAYCHKNKKYFDVDGQKAKFIELFHLPKDPEKNSERTIKE